MGEPITQSPTPQQTSAVKPMDFPDAMRQVIAGKKVTRVEWGLKGVYGFLNGNTLSLHKEDGKNYQWIVNDGDMLGEDWIVLA